MPAFYTHYRFGCDVLKQLPEDIRSICTAHRGLFDIGLHGPDIYFFYRPVLPNKVNRIGYAAHKRSGRYFLQRAQKVIASAHDKDAARAYFYGLLCHFTLDSICHPYIHTAMKEFNVTHAATPDAKRSGNDVPTLPRTDANTMAATAATKTSSPNVRS